MRVAAYGVIIDDGRILLAHWNGHGGLTTGAWTLPGGGLEAGEDPADAAVREIKEETGFDAVIEELLGIDSRIIAAEHRFHGDTPLHALRIVYRAHIVSGALTNELDGSTDEARWFALDELDSLERGTLVDFAVDLAQP